MKHKTISYRRDQRNRHIARKKRIVNSRHTTAVIDILNDDGNVIGHKADYSRVVPDEFYPFDGMYDKGKIHCSCGLCKPSRRFRKPSFKDELQDNVAREYIKDYINGAA